MQIIGIAGRSGSGKTTIAKEIYAHFGSENCIIISSDNYYNDLSRIPVEKREFTNFDHPDSIDFELLAYHLALLEQGQRVEIPIYDFTTHSRTEQTLTISPKSIIIVEGILVLYPESLVGLYNTKIFVDTDSDTCLIRRLQRDVGERGRTMEQVIDQYQRDVKPMYKKFVAPCRTHADIVIENNDKVAISEGVRFDIAPLINHLTSESKKNAGSRRFKLFSEPQVPASTVTGPYIKLS